MTNNSNEQISRVVEAYSGKLFAFVNRMLGDREEAKDIVQDTFVRVMRKLPDIKDPTRLSGYLFKTAYNLALNHKRDSKRKSDRHDALQYESSILSQVEHGQSEKPANLEPAIQTLSEKQQQVIRLRFFGQCKIDEIAAIMNITAGSVKVHLARGLQNLRNILCPVTGKEKQ